MTKEMTVFDFKGNKVRVVIDENGEPWWVAKDVCEVLGYKDALSAIKQHTKGVVKHRPLQTSGGTQNLRIINESDLYRLVIGSKLPAAQEFEKWVFEEVLPSIRKTGSYSVVPKTEFGMIEALAGSIQIMAREMSLLKNDVIELKQIQSTKADLTKMLPDVKDKTERQMLNEVVRSYAPKNSWEISDVWNKLYREFYYRYHINLKVKARNCGMSKLDYAEKHGYIKDLLALALELFA